LENQSGRQVLKTVSGKEIQADVVIAGIGIKPNTQLAEAAGLAVENGIVVDEYLQTSQPEIYAAGDVAFFISPTLGKRLRVEHEDNANTMGRIAGQNMAGQSTPYHHLPFFYSDLFDLGYEAVGELDPGFEVVANWLNPYQKGILYYLEDKKVRGVLLWNVWDQVEAARELISQAGPFELDELKARLPV
jgi:NADPH-dependent 2,4-dienoyl-CoA reductase/sulfur reductase-like enzyme